MTDTSLWIARLGAAVAFIGSLTLGRLLHEKDLRKQKILALLVTGSGFLINLFAKL